MSMLPENKYEWGILVCIIGSGSFGLADMQIAAVGCTIGGIILCIVNFYGEL